MVLQLTDVELAAALRFCETCEDGEGYDVPKPMMKRLASLGLVVPQPFGFYVGTQLLDRLQEEASAGVWSDFQITPDTSA